MISDYLMHRVVEYIRDHIAKATIVIDGEEADGEIMRVDITKNHLLKIFINTPRPHGKITDVRVYDKTGALVINRPQETEKILGYGLVSSFYIQLIEHEITDPNSVFKMGVENEV
ncbi:hypothetical protein [Peptoniphilus sp. EMRHCC_23]|uniref:hypothetical protein n=1 Tax=Peptoniphilus rachelemmaiella TaxID=2811779 RepID=UPI001C0054E4|nr:hypothetical protein [Peptoniphilus rachelemmaiella]